MTDAELDAEIQAILADRSPLTEEDYVLVRQFDAAIRAAELEQAMKRILPYLIWTISDESPGHHPTMPSAVAALKQTLEAKNIVLPTSAELRADLRTFKKVKVRPLEWIESVEGYWWFADFYKIEAGPDGIFTVLMIVPETFGKSRTLGRYLELDEAKTAAQKDFETRILAALSNSERTDG